MFNSLPTLEKAQPEVGSSGWKSIARHVVSEWPPVALENPEDRVPSVPDRTHNRIRIGSEGWAHGSQSRTSRLLANCSSDEIGSLRADRGTGWERLPRGPSSSIEQSTQNLPKQHKSRKQIRGQPQYEELSKQLNIQHAINQCYECMRAIKDRISRPASQLAIISIEPLYHAQQVSRWKSSIRDLQGPSAHHSSVVFRHDKSVGQHSDDSVELFRHNKSVGQSQRGSQSDVCIAIGSIATLDLPMVVDLIGIYGLKGPYRTLTTTNWFLQALSVIPRGSWGDVARRSYHDPLGVRRCCGCTSMLPVYMARLILLRRSCMPESCPRH
ncbi:hypothetical protein F511_20510 [Dorcoceras hygrometricum]|uniref:Uncharacterized protein n=1 Tax=Dorcoceras hygrometricum TaxID=472368 RepID=A0A2Z7CMT1_9LAMI|nr:hypothetical protein F511_20510 [Dorcoceras hygrometricum]